MRLLTQIFVASLILAKVVLGTIFLYHLGVDPWRLENQAIAAELETDPVEEPEKDVRIVKEEKIDMNFLLKKKAELSKKEEELEKKRTELMGIQKEINKKLKKLTQMRNEIKAEMNRKKTVEGKKLKHLIKVYSSMKPQQAAGLVEKLDMKLAIELLSAMKGEEVGKILSYVKVDRAAEISEGLVNRR